jgi:hypothetical protein
MSEDIIQDIWDKGKSQKQDLSLQEIERALRPDVRRQSIAIRMYIWLWLAILLGAFAMVVLNIEGYLNNSTMLMTHIGLAMLTIAFAAYGIHLLGEIRIMDRADESLMNLLERRRRFYRTKFEIWNLIMAATVVLLTFALNAYVDNDNGQHRINRVEIFVAFSLTQFGFIYGINKLAQLPIRKGMKIFLSDLGTNAMEGTQTLVGFRKRWRVWVVVFFIIGTILFLFGLWRALQFGS